MNNEPNASGSTANTLEMQQIEQARKQVNQVAEEIAQLAESDIPPAQMYSEFLQRIYFATQAHAGAVWIRTPQGNLQLQCQINLREVGLEQNAETRPMHDELLRQAITQGKGGIIKPHYSQAANGPDSVAGNPTDFIIILVPILQEKQVIGLVELWQDPSRNANALQSLYQFVVRMVGFISLFLRNHQLRQMVGQQELWLKLETFTRQIHNTLNLTEVAYLIANEARRLIEVDRVSVATRSSDKCQVSAISGADVVEKRSNLVQLMRKLFDSVIEWGERLVYTGTLDGTLPPKVLKSLDAYLAESNSKILVIAPLQDERDKGSKKPARSALMMECFETVLATEQLQARLDVVGRHACPALYNALEYQRIPMRFIWLPLAYLQDGLGGKAKAITTLSLTGVAILILALILIPFPLKMDASGTALPKNRIWVFSPIPGKVEDVMSGLASGTEVTKGKALLTMFDSDLEKRIRELQGEIDALANKINPLAQRMGEGGEGRGMDGITAFETRVKREQSIRMLEDLKNRTNAHPTKPGYYYINSPRAGIILSADFRENLLGRQVKPSDPLIRIGFTDPKRPKISDWEVELKIPQKHIGQILRAFESLPANTELDVDIMLKTEPWRSYRGKIRRDKIAFQANNQKDSNDEAEAVVMAWVRLDGNDIPEDDRMPAGRLITGTEVSTRIRCGNRAMGYSLFYGVWEFLFEKVIFPFT